jgi:hypothetical protein
MGSQQHYEWAAPSWWPLLCQPEGATAALVVMPRREAEQVSVKSIAGLYPGQACLNQIQIINLLIGNIT